MASPGALGWQARGSPREPHIFFPPRHPDNPKNPKYPLRHHRLSTVTPDPHSIARVSRTSCTSFVPSRRRRISLGVLLLPFCESADPLTFRGVRHLVQSSIPLALIVLEKPSETALPQTRRWHVVITCPRPFADPILHFHPHPLKFSPRIWTSPPESRSRQISLVHLHHTSECSIILTLCLCYKEVLTRASLYPPPCPVYYQ